MVTGPRRKSADKSKNSVGEQQLQHHSKTMTPIQNAVVLLLIFMAGFQVTRFDSYFRTLSEVDLKTYISQTASEVSSNLRAVSTSSATSISPSYQLAFGESYGFFDDVSDQDWKLYQDWARLQGNHRYTFDPKRQWGRPALWYYNNYNPIFNCPHAKRIAGIGDGPKWVCDPHRLKRQVERKRAAGETETPNSRCLIYSIGSNGNYEFEDGMVQYLGPDVCEIHIFDYSNDYDRTENAAKNIHFHQLGLQGSQQSRGNQFASFPEILKRLGHEGRAIDIFKIDCEGCEWDTFQDWVGYDIRQVLVEAHRLPSNVTLGFQFFDSFKENNLMMFSKEVNGFGGGEYYEFSYVKLHPSFLHPPENAGREAV